MSIAATTHSAANTPITTAVYTTVLRTRFRGLDARDGLLIRGPAGWGEFCPFWEYDDAESLPWLRAAWEAAYVGWPTPVRNAIPGNVTVPAVGPEDAARIVRESGGCTTAKVKVAQRDRAGYLEPLDAEIERLAVVRDALDAEIGTTVSATARVRQRGRAGETNPSARATQKPRAAAGGEIGIGDDESRAPGSAGPPAATGKIRIDANGAWTVEEALRRLRELDRAAGGLEYVEQPCATVPELAAVRRASNVPVAADEAIRRAADPMAVVRADAADIIVLKVAPLGGVRACLELADQVGRPVVVSSALESSVGIAAGLALAGALPELPYACGLATVNLFARDVADRPLLPVDGRIPVRPVAPDPQRLADVAAPEDLSRRWRERLARVAALGEPGEFRDLIDALTEVGDE